MINLHESIILSLTNHNYDKIVKLVRGVGFFFYKVRGVGLLF